MIGILAVAAFAMFMHDNAEFIGDMNDKYEMGCTFTYQGKTIARDDVPNIAIDDTYIYFTMEPCYE
jgi:hypothetical protein